MCQKDGRGGSRVHNAVLQNTIMRYAGKGVKKGVSKCK